MNRPAKQYLNAVKLENMTGIPAETTLIFYDYAPYLGAMLLTYFIGEMILKRCKKWQSKR